jgi:hypothetical protein
MHQKLDIQYCPVNGYKEVEDLYKSRICIVGCYQKEGVDSVAKLDSIRFFIAILAIYVDDI